MKDEMTGPSWDRYRLLKEEHDRRFIAGYPKRENFTNDEDYRRAVNEWIWTSSVDAPTKPNAEYANNH